MTTSPQSYLAPQSQPWGRFVDKSLADITETTRLNALNTSNNLKQLNSSVNLLSNQQVALAAQQTQLTNQQNYLATFQTYVSTSPSTISGLTYNSRQLLRTTSLNFTLSRASVVMINSQFTYTGTSRENGGYSSSYVIEQVVSANSGTYSAVWNDYEYGVPGYLAFHQSGGTGNGQYLVSFPAGNHTVTSQIYYELYGSYTGSYGVSTKNIILTATVIG